MITIEKHTNSVSEAINIIIEEVLGNDSEFAKSISDFIRYKQPRSSIRAINLCSCDNNSTTTKISDTNLNDLKVEYNLYEISSYKDFVEYVLYTLSKNIPTPLNNNPYNLTIGNNFASIRFPNNISISIKTFIIKDTIKYSINIVFHCVPALDPYVRESDEYKAAIANGWKIKDDHHKPIKKNI